MTEPHEVSRRDFLAAAALGLLGVAAGDGQGGGIAVDEELLYVGTYTDKDRSDGIYMLRVDPRSGELGSVASIHAAPNPSFLALHPNARMLYAVQEDEYGAVSAFTIARDSGALTRLGNQPSGGSGPCFASVDKSGRVVLVANYDSGSVALLPVGTDGALGAATAVIRHTGSGPVADRQSGPHAHCIMPDATNRFALAADLGADRVFVYRLDAAAGSLQPVSGGEAVLHPGAGPRHLAFHPTQPLVFVSCELDSTVATLRFDAERGALSVLEARSTLPAGWTGTNYPADIHIAPLPLAGGHTVYVSNRGHNSIAVFSVAGDGALTLVQAVSTGGDWPRNFTIDPTGRWLLVANQKSNSIVVFRRDEERGTLTPTPQRIAVPSPVCLRFHASP